jgi:hypothetical protein
MGKGTGLQGEEPKEKEDYNSSTRNKLEPAILITK